jgi:hypothetical protein
VVLNGSNQSAGFMLCLIALSELCVASGEHAFYNRIYRAAFTERAAWGESCSHKSLEPMIPMIFAQMDAFAISQGMQEIGSVSGTLRSRYVNRIPASTGVDVEERASGQ